VCRWPPRADSPSGWSLPLAVSQHLINPLYLPQTTTHTTRCPPPQAVTLYASTGGAPLQKRAEVANAPVSPSDLHIGVLRLPQNGKQLQTGTGVYYSNMWIESGGSSGL
jgi:hypothetical protein